MNFSKTQAGAFSEFTRAIIVGISDYSAPLFDLPACAKEANALKNVLIDPSGCALPSENVELIPEEKATAKFILSTFKSTLSRCTPDDVLMFYFAGHGVDHESGFMLCTGSNDESQGMLSVDFDKLLRSARVRGLVVILDCCGGARLVEGVPSFFRTNDQCEFKLFISASRAQQSSWELTDKRQSLFTNHLLIALSGSNEIGTKGAIYFTDLFDYLHTSVQESAQKFLGDSNLQEPVFTGTFSKDPLLFLHRNQTLSATRVRIQRVTREHLRHKVKMTITALVGTMFCILGGYWAYLDNTQYLDDSEENVSLYHGHPEFSGFGLPRKIWEYDFGSELIRNVHSNLITSRRSNINEMLDSVLSITGKVELQVLEGKIEFANSSLRQAIDQIESPSPRLLQLMEGVVREGDEDWLTNRALEANPEHAASFIHALATFDGERAVRTLRTSAIRDNFGHQLNLLSKWSAPCGPATQSWFQDFLNSDSNWIPVPTVALAAIRSNCRFPVETAILVQPNFLESAIMALKLTSPADAEKLGTEVAEELISAAQQSREFDAWDADIPSKHAQLIARLFLLSQLIGEPVCVPEFLKQLPHEPLVKTNITTRLHLLALLHRGCQGSTLRIEIGVVAMRVFLINMQGEETEVLYLPTRPEVTASILPVLDLLIEAETPNVEEALLDILDHSSNPDLRLALVRRLRYLSADGARALDYILPQQYMLERELIRWLASTNLAEASGYLVHRLNDFQNVTLLETLALVNLIATDRNVLLQSSNRFEQNARIITHTLVGETQVVADFLTSPNSAVRNSAIVYAPLRSDWSMLKNAMTHSPYIARALLTGERLDVDISSLENELNATPLWALPWLARILDHQGVTHPAVALRLEQLRESMKIRWTSNKG